MNENNFSKLDLEMTRRALELAARGTGRVSPSPLVGCVIVTPEGEIAGEGTYIFENLTHAEVSAIRQAGKRAEGGTAYVSLEPHAHFGRTPPCTEALINAGIKKVVCPIEDPNPLVSGKGFEFLREKNVEVITGILKAEAEKQNEKFIHWHKFGRPFVHLKLAMSLDGRISLKNSVSTALSGEISSEKVQALRHEHDAILVGGSTAFVDNPSLTDRSGKPRRRNLARIILDNRLRLPENSILVETAGEAPTIVFSNSDDREKIERLQKKGVSIIPTDARDLPKVLEELKKLDLQSVLVEGGTEIAGSFVDAKLVEKVTFIYAPLILGGKKAPLAVGGHGARNLGESMRLERLEINRHGVDFELTGYPVKQFPRFEK